MTSKEKKETLMTTSNLAIMIITYLVLGSFLFLAFLSQRAINSLEEQTQVTLFFKDDFTEPNIKSLEESVKADPRIESTRYVSKEEALKIFIELNKEEPLLLESVSASILPASLEIKAKNIKDLAPLAEELGKVDGVEEVKFFKDVIDRFKFWRNVAYGIGGIVVATFIMISISVVIASLRITINTRGKEFEILKLVGASDEYVKTPLIKQGVFYGLTSASIAAIIILLATIGITFTVRKSLSFDIPSIIFALVLGAFLVALGWALSYFGSVTAIKKYLKY